MFGWCVRGDFNPIETTLMREIKDALDSFSDAFGHLFDYGCCFFPDMMDVCGAGAGKEGSPKDDYHKNYHIFQFFLFKL